MKETKTSVMREYLEKFRNEGPSAIAARITKERKIRCTANEVSNQKLKDKKRQAKPQPKTAKPSSNGQSFAGRPNVPTPTPTPTPTQTIKDDLTLAITHAGHLLKSTGCLTRAIRILEAVVEVREM